MKIYTVYVKNGRRENLESAFFVREGFSFLAGIFQTLWAVYNRMWVCAAVLLAVNIFILVLLKDEIINPEVSAVVKIGLFVFVGFSANDWYRADLSKKGFKFFEVVSGENLLDAKRRFFSSYLEGRE